MQYYFIITSLKLDMILISEILRNINSILAIKKRSDLRQTLRSLSSNVISGNRFMDSSDTELIDFTFSLSKRPRSI